MMQDTSPAPVLLAGFLSRVRSSPHSIALTVEDGRSFSYGELDGLAEGVATAIASNTTTPAAADLLVSITMRRDVGMVAAILGVLKAGAAYVPVDPSFPPERQAYIVAHSRCQCAVVDCDASCPNQAPPLLPTLLVDSRSGTLLRALAVTHTLFSAPSMSSSARSTPLAYVLYTSGSTGNPKGVMVRQESVVNIVDWFARELHVGPGKRVLGLTTFCFDISVLEMFMPLLHGATLVLAFSSTQKDPFRLADLLKEHSVDVLQATPTTFEMLLAAGWEGDAQLDVLIGGEAFRPTLLPLVGTCRSVRNVYGPTETTIWSSSYTLPRDMEGPTASISIGAPISHTSFYLASEADWRTLAAEGCEGELCIGGVGVAKGYLHAPDLTKDKFISCPYPGGTGLIYRTGDIVKRLPDSDCYVFVRRMDDQVKIDGFRIELAEIEQVYIQHPLVEQAVALVRNGRLAIYLKAVPGCSLGENEREEVQAAAALKLTYYMMPKDTVIVAQFPQTANGKLDRKALPDPPRAKEEQDALKAPLNIELSFPRGQPKTMVEHICNVFQAVRGRRPNPNASFASMGIDSLGAVLFIRSLSDSVGGAKIKPADVYSPGVTIRSFALLLHQRLASENRQALLNLGISVEVDTRASFLKDGGDGVDLPPDPATSEFEELVASNTGLFEGLRGIFALMVLYDHFHNPQDPLGYSLAINSDVNLFVILTGFTTALQLRDVVPRYADFPLRTPRAAFNWRNFLLTRAVGIFPILWFAILLCTPRWVLQNQGGMGFMVQERRKLVVSEALSGECAFLYVIGMQLWDVRCRRVGPDDLAYSCIIWNCFLMYFILRFGLRLVQNYFLGPPQKSCCATQGWDAGLLKWYQDGKFVKLEEGLVVKTDNKVASPSLPRLIDLVVFNRLPVNYARTLAAFWFVLFFGLFNVLWLRSSQSKNPITFISYFMAGVVVAAVWENSHWCHFNNAIWGKRIQPLVNRFGADAILFLSAFLCAPFSAMQSGEATSFGNFLKWSGIPILVVIFLPLACGQKPGVERKNFSRFITENPFAQTLGYASYTLYLFQHVALEFYGHIIAENVKNGRSYPQNAEEYGALYLHQWFEFQPPGLQTCGILTLIVFCCLVQYVVQDRLVAGLYSRVFLR